MKPNDQFLRVYRKTPRRAFSENLYKKLSRQSSFALWLKRSAAWGLMVALVVYGMSSNLLTAYEPGVVTPVADSAAGVTVAREENMALLGERGLQPREYTPPPTPKEDEDWLGPFDRPQPVEQQAEESTSSSQEVALLVVPAISR